MLYKNLQQRYYVRHHSIVVSYLWHRKYKIYREKIHTIEILALALVLARGLYCTFMHKRIYLASIPTKHFTYLQCLQDDT